MAAFCNQCAKAMGFPGDFTTVGADAVAQGAEPLSPGGGWVVLCEGCETDALVTMVDNVGNCIYRHCRTHNPSGDPVASTPTWEAGPVALENPDSPGGVDSTPPLC